MPLERGMALVRRSKIRIRLRKADLSFSLVIGRLEFEPKPKEVRVPGNPHVRIASRKVGQLNEEVCSRNTDRPEKGLGFPRREGVEQNLSTRASACDREVPTAAAVDVVVQRLNVVAHKRDDRLVIPVAKLVASLRAVLVDR